MRNFIRHSSDIPIEVTIESNDSSNTLQTRNVSHGGISFASSNALRTGTMITIRIPSISKIFKIEGQVAWCKKHKDEYSVGIEFLDATQIFTARMVEQICQIESYRKNVFIKENRVLSSDEAAEEWISQFAEDFPEWIYLRPLASDKISTLSK